MCSSVPFPLVYQVILAAEFQQGTRRLWCERQRFNSATPFQEMILKDSERKSCVENLLVSPSVYNGHHLCHKGQHCTGESHLHLAIKCWGNRVRRVHGTIQKSLWMQNDWSRFNWSFQSKWTNSGTMRELVKQLVKLFLKMHVMHVSCTWHQGGNIYWRQAILVWPCQEQKMIKDAGNVSSRH